MKKPETSDSAETEQDPASISAPPIPEPTPSFKVDDGKAKEAAEESTAPSTSEKAATSEKAPAEKASADKAPAEKASEPKNAAKANNKTSSDTGASGADANKTESKKESNSNKTDEKVKKEEGENGEQAAEGEGSGGAIMKPPTAPPVPSFEVDKSEAMPKGTSEPVKATSKREKSSAKTAPSEQGEMAVDSDTLKPDSAIRAPPQPSPIPSFDTSLTPKEQREEEKKLRK